MGEDTAEVESVMVETNGHFFDVVSFGDSKSAAAYRKAIERWGRKAGIEVRIWSQRTRVPLQPHQNLSARLNTAQ